MKRSELILMILQVPVDFLMLLFATTAAYYLRFTDWAIALKPILFDLTFGEFFEIGIIVAIGWLIVFAAMGLYSTNPNRKFVPEVLRVFFATLVGLSAVALYLVFTHHTFDSRFLILFSWGFAVLFLMVGRLFVRGLKGLLYRSGVGLRKIVIIGSDTIAKELKKELQTRKELGYEVVALYKTFSDATTKKIAKKHIDELIFTNSRGQEKDAMRAMNYCHEHHIVFKYSADLFSSYASHRETYPLAGIPIVELKRTKLEGWGRVIKRIADMVFGTILLMLASPIILVVSLIILIETGRPVFYKNERVGYKGNKFIAYKFRSMYQKDSIGKEFGGAAALKREQALIKKQNTRKGPIYKVGQDPRVTPFGRFIRRFSLDELPQFMNVIEGTMSLVGPRPHQPREVAGYVKEHKKVFSVKPGITGLAQVSGRSDLPYEEEARLDVFYIEHWSFTLDIVLFLKTPFILLKRRKAL